MTLYLRGATLGVSVLVVSALLVPSGASATYEPGDPEVTWGVQVDTSYDEMVQDVDTADGVVWSVGYRIIDHGPRSQGVVMRHDAEGRELGRLVDQETDKDNFASAVDAFDDGAVVAGIRDLTSAYVQRLAADGSVIWTVEYGVEDQVGVGDVTVRGDTVYAVGAAGGQFGRFRVDTFSLETGAHTGSRTFGSDGSLSSVVALGDQIIVGGMTMGEVVAGERQGEYDNVLVALDPDDLSTRWQHQFGTPGLDFIADLTTWDGTLYWAGTLGNENENPFSRLVGGLGAVAPDGTFLWRRQLGPGYAVVRALTATSEGLVLGGEVEPGELGAEVASYGDDDAFIQGRAFTGETLWTEVYGTQGYDIFATLAADGDRLYAGGVTDGRMFGNEDGSGRDATLAALDVPHLQRPDLSLRADGRGFVGDNRYGTSRTIRLRVQPGERRTATVRLEDDGLIGDRLTLRSCEGERHLTMRFRQGRRDVSSSIRNGTFRTRVLRPGGAQRLTLAVTADRTAAGVHRCVLKSRSSARTHRVDRLRVRIVVVR